MKLSTLKLKLITACALQLLMNSELRAEFDLEDFDSKAHRARYNSLPSVEESDRELQKTPQFQSFLKDAEEVVSRYELNDLMGLRLIHRHFTLGENQVMAEKYEVVDKVPSLVTQARPLDEAQEMKALPSSWMFSPSPNRDVLLFEASSDPAVVRVKAVLEKSPEFFDEMGKTIGEHNLSHLISLAVLKRESIIPKDEQIFMEVNYADPSKSVVQVWSSSEKPKTSISTSWSFNGPREQKCWQYNWCLQRDESAGGHLEVTSHDRVQDQEIKK